MLFAVVFLMMIGWGNAAEPKPDMAKAYQEASRWTHTLRDTPSSAEMLKTGGKILSPSGVCTKRPDQHVKPCSSAKEKNPPQVSSLPPDRIYVFISLSMPKESLVQLMKEAPRHNAVIVMRGLKEDSFLKTAQALKEGGELSGGVEIHPDLFERFQITAVPVFVRVQSDQEVHRLAGNVTLSFAVQKLKETP